MINNFAPLFMIIIALAFLLKKTVKIKPNPTIYISISIVIIIAISFSIFGLFKVIFADEDSDKYGWHVQYMDYENIHKYSLGENQKIALVVDKVRNNSMYD